MLSASSDQVIPRVAAWPTRAIDRTRGPARRLRQRRGAGLTDILIRSARPPHRGPLLPRANSLDQPGPIRATNQTAELQPDKVATGQVSRSVTHRRGRPRLIAWRPPGRAR